MMDLHGTVCSYNNACRHTPSEGAVMQEAVITCVLNSISSCLVFTVLGLCSMAESAAAGYALRWTQVPSSVL